MKNPRTREATFEALVLKPYTLVYFDTFARAEAKRRGLRINEESRIQREAYT